MNNGRSVFRVSPTGDVRVNLDGSSPTVSIVTLKVSLTLDELSSVAVTTTSAIPFKSVTENIRKVSPDMFPVISPEEIENENLRLSNGRSISLNT